MGQRRKFFKRLRCVDFCCPHMCKLLRQGKLKENQDKAIDERTYADDPKFTLTPRLWASQGALLGLRERWLKLTDYKIECLFLAPMPVQPTTGFGPYWLVPNTARMVMVGEVDEPCRGPAKNTSSACVRDGPVVRDPAVQDVVDMGPSE